MLVHQAPALLHHLFETQDGRSPTGSRTYGEDDTAVQFMIYSTFQLQSAGPACSGPMETSHVVKLYKPSPTPILYVGPVLGQVSLMPLFLSGNSLPTILHCCFFKLQSSNSHMYCCADVAKESCRKESNIYEPSMRSTNGCGTLGVASLVPGVCQFLRQKCCKWL